MDPIELEYENMDTVPEAVRGLYTEQDGKAVLTGVNGMKTSKDIENVQEALRKERDSHKQTQNAFKPFKNLNADEVIAKLDKYPELEALAGDGGDVNEKVNKIVETRLSQATSPLQRQIDTLTEERDSAIQDRDSAKGKITDMTMSSAIRSAASSAKIVSTALSDVEIIAKNAFELTEDGNLITKDGVNGVTPGIGLDAYFREQQKNRPHWWPASEGGGAGGSGSGGRGGEKNPFTNANWNLTQQGQLQRENPELASQLAKSAGTTVGGAKPPAKS